jgi:uncharacterized protein (UPF0128 family)
MTKPQKPIPKHEDPEQSRRFLEEARAIEAAGGLSVEEAERAFEEGLRKISRQGASSGGSDS